MWKDWSIFSWNQPYMYYMYVVVCTYILHVTCMCRVPKKSFNMYMCMYPVCGTCTQCTYCCTVHFEVNVF